MGDRLTRLPLVSVIVPTRNRLAFLVECVDSVLLQTYKRCELIVVDDASTDGTGSWLSGREGPCFRVHHMSRHSERSAARNRGLEDAKGDFVLFLDDDDRLRPSAVEDLATALAGKPHTVVAAVGGATMFDAAGHYRRAPHVPVSLTANLWDAFLFGYMLGPPSRACFRKQFVLSVGGWTEKYTFGEDLELWLKIARLGPVALVPRTVVEVRVHEAQYRPREADELLSGVRADYVSAHLSGAEDVDARRILASRERWLEGLQHSVDGRFSEALTQLVGAMTNSPKLLRSPVLAPTLGGRVVRTAALAAFGPVGPRLRNTGADLKLAARRALKRLPSRG